MERTRETVMGWTNRLSLCCILTRRLLQPHLLHFSTGTRGIQPSLKFPVGHRELVAMVSAALGNITTTALNGPSQRLKCFGFI